MSLSSVRYVAALRLRPAVEMYRDRDEFNIRLHAEPNIRAYASGFLRPVALRFGTSLTRRASLLQLRAVELRLRGRSEN